jgi:hypothetical protein
MPWLKTPALHLIQRRQPSSGSAGWIEMGKANEEARLARLTKICLALPGATRQVLGSHAGFCVRKKMFAYFLNDHHGDGIVSVCAKVLPGDNTALISAQPARFYARLHRAERMGRVETRSRRGELEGSGRTCEDELSAGRAQESRRKAINSIDERAQPFFVTLRQYQNTPSAAQFSGGVHIKR